MRWWLNTDHKRFSVDNAVVNGLDFSALPSDIWMVQWIDGKGEIERQVDADTNDNGLREQFIDIIPYCEYFQQFLARVPRLTLPQAKKVQIDLIKEIYNAKRQAPFHYPVAAGDYWWDATDDTLFASTVPALQNAITAINAAAAQVNALVNEINAKVVAPGDETITQINAYVVDRGNNYVVAPGNNILSYLHGTLVPLINSQIVAPHNALCGEVNGKASGPGWYLTEYINNALVGYRDYDHPDYNTINNRLRTDAPVMGFVVDIAYHPNSFDNVVAPAYDVTNITFDSSTFFFPFVALTTDFQPITLTPLPPVTTTNVSWIPIGATAPVPVTPAEAGAILQGIAARTNALNVKRNIKIGEVNALTEIQDVIDYDVTSGW